MARTKKGRNPSSNRLIDEPIDEHMENQSIRVEELQNTDDETNGDVEAKKTRGPTYMTSVWGQPTSHRYKVKFNKLGKLVDKNKSRFTEFLGTISRNGSYAPIDVQDWRKIDKSRKKDMLNIVKLAMNEKVSQLPPDTEDPIGKNDVFAQVVGQDKHGHVRMYGFGVCPTNVWGDEPSRSGSQRLVLDQKHEILEMKAKFAQQEEQIKKIKQENLLT